MSMTKEWNREIAIRRRISNIFNKREDDFPSLRDYNDYLEEVEDMTVSLIEGRDVAGIEAKINQYERENQEQIMISRAHKAEELQDALRASRASGHTDPVDGTAGSTQGTVGAVGVQGQYAPTSMPGGLAQPRPIGMVPQPLPVRGQLDPLQGYPGEDEEAMKLRLERGARAGGWSLELSKKRAVEEAFSSICI